MQADSAILALDCCGEILGSQRIRYKSCKSFFVIFVQSRKLFVLTSFHNISGLVLQRLQWGHGLLALEITNLEWEKWSGGEIHLNYVFLPITEDGNFFLAKWSLNLDVLIFVFVLLTAFTMIYHLILSSVI